MRRRSPSIRFTTTCERHQKRFIALMDRHGVRDPMQIERIRKHFAIVVARTYPATFRDRIRKGACIGCVFDEAGEVSRQWMVDALTALIRGTELPRIAMRSWEARAYKHGEDAG